jgi:hypothetical protein
MVYENEKEMNNVVGKFSENSFIKMKQKEFLNYEIKLKLLFRKIKV